MLTERIESVGEYLTRAQAAEQLQVSLRTVDRYVLDGTLASKKLPGNRLVRIPKAAVDAMLAPDGGAAA